MQEHVRQIWDSCQSTTNNPVDCVAQGVTQLHLFFLETSRAKLQGKRTKSKILQKSLGSLQRLWERKPTELLSTQIEEVKQNIQHNTNARYQFQYHTSSSRWTQKGDRATTECFKITCPLRLQGGISELALANGSLTTTDYFKQLLTTENTEFDSQLRQHILSFTPSMISPDMQ